MIPLPWRLICAGVAVLAVVGLLFWIRHDAYKAGQAEREAYYSPILADIQRQADAAKARVQELEQAASAINDMISNEDKQRAEDAKNQRDDALRRLADMRVRLASALGRRCPVPEVSGDAAGTARAASDAAERFRRASERLARVAFGCKRDGDRYELAGNWYREQRAKYEVATVASEPSPQTR